MLERSSNTDAVARAFLLAERLSDRLKKAPTDRDGFRAALVAEREKLAALSGPALLELVPTDRRARFEKGAWVLAIVNLDRCSVRPGMGGEDWARGPVIKIANQFPSRSMPGNPVRVLIERVPDIFADLPLIAIRTRSDHARYRLDDGSHRAVAYYLAGFRQAFAFVERVPSSLNHTWKWEG